MIKYVSDQTGNEYETEEEAREEMYERMDFTDYIDHLNLSTYEIFQKLQKAGVDYFGIFDEEFCEAENEYFDENYYTVEAEDDDEG